MLKNTKAKFYIISIIAMSKCIFSHSPSSSTFWYVSHVPIFRANYYSWSFLWLEPPLIYSMNTKSSFSQCGNGSERTPTFRELSYPWKLLKAYIRISDKEEHHLLPSRSLLKRKIAELGDVWNWIVWWANPFFFFQWGKCIFDYCGKIIKAETSPILSCSPSNYCKEAAAAQWERETFPYSHCCC